MANILTDLGLKTLLMTDATTVYNDNLAGVNWSNAQTTKGLCHLQMHNNTIREL